MDVDVDELEAGAGRSRDAAILAMEAAERLSPRSLLGGFFGSFAEAEAFGAEVGEARSTHALRLRKHRATLAAIGDRADLAARTFAATEECDAAALRTLQWLNTHR